MSTAPIQSRIRSHLDLDFHAGLLVGLLLAVQLVAVWLAAGLTAYASASTATSLPAQTSTPETGGLWVGVVIVESVVLVVLWRYASLIPVWVREGLKKGAWWSFICTILWGAYLVGGLGLAAVGVVGGVGGLVLARLDLYWLLHNAFAFGLAVVATLGVGVAFSPRVVLVLLALLTVWDMVAVWGSDWMDGLIGMASSTGVPIYVVLPGALRIDMDAVGEWLGDQDGPRPDGVAGMLGVGDLALPTALSVSAVVALPGGWTVPVGGAIVGSLAGMVVLRGSLADEALPALPWLTSGTVLGFGVGLLASSTSLLAVLGGGL